MTGYYVVIWIHIISAALFLGTGRGAALCMWLAHKGGNVRTIAATANHVVRLDRTFTAVSGLALPVTGAILVWMAGFSPGVPWLVASCILYAIAFVCWVFLAWFHRRVRDLATAAAANGEALPGRYYRYMRWGFQLGWRALIALLVVAYLMVAQPQAGGSGAGIPSL